MYSVSIRACNRYHYQWQLHYNMCVSYVFTAYIYRPVLRLMYRIHTHIHYIVLERLLTYCTRFLSPLSRYPYFCIVASYTAIYIPLIPWFADLYHALTVASCSNTSSIALSFRHCKHTAFLIRLYISLTFIIN